MKPYTVKLGPYTHLIHSDGSHEVVGKDKKQPQAYYYKDGHCHFIDLARDLKLDTATRLSTGRKGE